MVAYFVTVVKIFIMRLLILVVCGYVLLIMSYLPCQHCTGISGEFVVHMSEFYIGLIMVVLKENFSSYYHASCLIHIMDCLNILLKTHTLFILVLCRLSLIMHTTGKICSCFSLKHTFTTHWCFNTSSQKVLSLGNRARLSSLRYWVRILYLVTGNTFARSYGYVARYKTFI